MLLKNSRLYVIVDRDVIKKRDVAKVTEDALRGGADIIQLRDKSSSDKRLLQCAKKIKNITRKYKRIFIINDRADIARLVNADGVHLGQNDIPIKEARRLLGKKIVGVSTHSLSDAKKAQKKGADYIGAGPIFETPTKKNLSPIGLSILTKLRKEIDIPFFAIGGISISDIPDVKKSGEERIAVVSSAIKTNNVYKAVRKLRKALYGEY